MSETWKRTLSLPNLPKKLASRRNLHAYFSKFGDVQGANVNKDNRTGVVVFATRAEAKAAKTLGKVYENKPLRILWFENALETTDNSFDLRARQKEGITEVDNLWEEDDKECFGVETKPVNTDRKNTAQSMIKQHLKLPEVKKSLVSSLTKTSVINRLDDSESDKSTVEVNKLSQKMTMKKILASKRKLLRKEGLTTHGRIKKIPIVTEARSLTVSASEPVDSKQKLSLLDERDKLIRQKTVKDSNIKTAVAIKGTCPDMCPERERILRQCGHQVAVYESLPGTNEMDENRAIKEYIRSSADQEVPLPHDLRPAPVLSMTMNYLITNIINQIDDPNENKAVWYSFCWNRLRSIRKDIILQQLCDLETVTIVEQCARFHICCYDHMWGVDISGYSDKINTNNLIDCLQTLKHLYEDLAKHNVKCSNEPEFHAYLILLKLTTGDVFWEYQQYAPEIQFSSKVQFAIEVYMAFINNMYSKYFSLVKQASYLEACLMQRHFDEVRTRALKVMSKAYSLPNKNVRLTPSFLEKCLKFDSQRNVLKFCEKIKIELDKITDFDEDDEDKYVLTSSYLIKNKRLPIANAVVGENNPLPIYVPHQVHSSFDEEGRLREPLQSSTDECYDSYESPMEESDVSVPDVKIETDNQNKTFKFSLSPKVTKETVFSSSVFSRLAPFNTKQENLTNTGLAETDPTELQSSKFEFGLPVDLETDQSFYEEQTESIDMEENMDEEIVSDEDFVEKAEEAVPEKPLQFTEFGSVGKSLFGNHQSFFSMPTVPILPATNNNSQLQTNENQHKEPFSSTNISPKHRKKENFKFSFSPKLLTEDENFSNFINSEKKPIASKAYFQKTHCVESQVDNFNKYIVQNEIETHADSKVEKLFVPPDRKSLEKLQEKRKELFKREQEILEKKLIEEEKIKIEEAKRVELERQKRQEKKKAFEKLRKDLHERMKAKNAKKYVRLWKTRIDALKKKRADFPMLQQLSVENHLRLWGGMKYIPTTSVFQRAKDRQSLDNIVSQLLKYGVNDSCKYIGQDLAELLAKSVARTINMGSIRPVFWKVAMSLPWKDRFNPKYAIFNQMMRRCCKQSFYSNTDAELGSVESVVTSLQIPVHVSVHVSDDLLSCRDLQGMDALIFVVADGFESEKSCLDRLRRSVTSQARSSDLSVSVMSINGNQFDRVLKMELEELQEQSLVAFWTVNEWTTSNCLLRNLAFLTENVKVSQNVCARSLESLVREAVDDFIYDVDKSQVYCSSLIVALENPNTVINIYNTFLTKLEDLLLSSKLEKYFNFAKEFKSYIPSSDCGGPELLCGKQYDDQYKSIISSTINALKLPGFQGWPVNTNHIDFDSLAELLETYCRTQIEDMEVFKQVIRKLAQEVADPSSLLNSYSWLHIVEMWAESRSSHVFSSSNKRMKMFVIYNKNDLQLMIQKQWWLKLPMIAKSCQKI